MKQTESGVDKEVEKIDFNLGDDAYLRLYKQFYPLSEADELFHSLLSGIAWSEETILIFGKWVKIPRLMCWYGDSNAFYCYCGVSHSPNPWIPELLPLKAKVEHECQSPFNSVLANLYRDGNDSMGCHSDNEKELGINPTIASLSFGDGRLFKLHHKKTKQSLSLILEHGDLLVMGGTCQQKWLHAVPKTKAYKTPRINLTFRKIMIDAFDRSVNRLP